MGAPHWACELPLHPQKLGIQAKDLPALGYSGLLCTEWALLMGTVP